MSAKILESDWKIFGELRPVALERLCAKILADAKTVIEGSEGSAHEKYGKLYALILERDKEIARSFDGFRRSTAIEQIGLIHKLKLFTGAELRRFSPETLHFVGMYGPIPKD